MGLKETSCIRKNDTPIRVGENSSSLQMQGVYLDNYDPNSFSYQTQNFQNNNDNNQNQNIQNNNDNKNQNIQNNIAEPAMPILSKKKKEIELVLKNGTRKR